MVAKETKPIRNDLRTLAWILAGTTAAGASVAATLAWLVVSRALVPVRQLSREIAGIKPSELGQRVEVAGLPSEVQPVAERLNEMLGRLAIAFERERAFTADAAHELRTPLAGIRSIAEVAVSSPQSVEESGRDFREIVQVTTGMQAMVEKVFGRFWRADPSRTGNSGHWGLGLSLVSRTMSLMGGTAHAQLAEGGLFCLSLCLPTGEIPAVDPCGGA